MILITTIDELAHIMNGEHRINAKVYIVQIITGSNVV